MNATAYRAQIARLGLSQEGASRILGVNPRTARRWAADEIEVPPTVQRLLWACEHCPGLVDALRAEWPPNDETADIAEADEMAASSPLR